MENDIINILSNKERPNLSTIEINDLLGYTTIEEYQKLDKKLKEMAALGILYYSEKNKKYLLLENSHLVKGKLLMNRKGFGFVEIGNGKDDIYINKNNLNTARHNDIVLIELIGDKEYLLFENGNMQVITVTENNRQYYQNKKLINKEKR